MWCCAHGTLQEDLPATLKASSLLVRKRDISCQHTGTNQAARLGCPDSCSSFACVRLCVCVCVMGPSQASHGRKAARRQHLIKRLSWLSNHSMLNTSPPHRHNGISQRLCCTRGMLLDPVALFSFFGWGCVVSLCREEARRRRFCALWIAALHIT